MKSIKSSSEKVTLDKAFKILGLPKNASTEEITSAYKAKLDELQKKHANSPDKLVAEADKLYNAYQKAYMSKEGAVAEEMLPMTITGPDSLLELFGISDIAGQSLKVQMSSQTQYKDGRLVKQESNRHQSFINKDGKREVKVWENGRLVKHTIEGKDVASSRKTSPS